MAEEESREPVDPEGAAPGEETAEAAAGAQAADTEAHAAVDDEAPTQQWSSVGEPGEEQQIDAAIAAAEELDAARREVDDWKARAYRVTADLDNVRKRFQKEREELRRFAIEGLLKDMLPIIDNLERAVQHAEQNGSEGLVDGVKLVLRQFTQTLAGKGAEPFDALGEPFDPQLHEAMTEMPTTEYEPGHVANVFQRGWKLNGRLVRPAMVVVAKAPPSEDD